MTLLVIDSDVVIDVLNGWAPSVARLHELRSVGRFAVSVVTIGEVVHGINRGKNPDGGYRLLDALLQTVAVLPVDEAIARRFGVVRARLQSLGLTVGDLDVLIGATALHYDATLVTANLKDFGRIEGLRIEAAR